MLTVHQSVQLDREKGRNSSSLIQISIDIGRDNTVIVVNEPEESGQGWDLALYNKHHLWQFCILRLALYKLAAVGIAVEHVHALRMIENQLLA